MKKHPAQNRTSCSKPGILLTGIALLMCLILVPFTEANAKRVYEGKCGPNVFWNYDCKSDTLTVSGQGEMLSCGWMNNDVIQDTMRKAVIEEGVTSICHSAFSPKDTDNNYNFLEKGIKLPSTLQSIGDNAFTYSGLMEIEIPSGVKHMGSGIFQQCSRLKNVILPEHLTRIELGTFIYCYSLKNVSIPPSVSYIGEEAFGYCKEMKNITLPDNVKEVGDRGFINCYNLEAVQISGVTQIPSGMFLNCRNLKKVKLSNDLLCIQDQAFKFCSQLEEIDIPENVQSIGKGAFSNCISLKELHLPGNTASLGEKAFKNCISLKSIGMPESVWKIGENLKYRVTRNL